MFTKKSCYLIAEIVKFSGNISLAKKMIVAAKKSVIFVKFQIWNPKNLKDGDWDHDGERKYIIKFF